uniref:Uncharacterized protein n=1 Tax=viral metagenome TaxID=1070528 RepID=A0A6C0EL63_9ZZZZ
MTAITTLGAFIGKKIGTSHVHILTITLFHVM